MHSAANFSLHTVTVSAEREDGPTPGARVTWSTQYHLSVWHLSQWSSELVAVGV